MEGSLLILLSDNCPVIESGTRVKVIKVLDFPRSGRKFVTIQDDVHIPLSKHGQVEPIVSTIELTENTFQEDWIPIGYEPKITIQRK